MNPNPPAIIRAIIVEDMPGFRKEELPMRPSRCRNKLTSCCAVTVKISSRTSSIGAEKGISSQLF
jgi:hypothetical protein